MQGVSILVPLAPTLVDLGTVAEESLPDGLIRQTYRFQNQSRASAEVVAVSSTCSCAKVEVSRELIPPGALLEVTMVVTPSWQRRTGAIAKIAMADGALIECGVQADVRAPCETFAMGAALQLAEDAPEAVLRLLAVGSACDAAPEPSVVDARGEDVRWSGWACLLDATGEPTNVRTSELRVASSLLTGRKGLYVQLAGRTRSSSWVPIEIAAPVAADRVLPPG